MLATGTGQSGWTQADSFDAIASDHVHTRAAVQTFHTLALAFGRAHRVLRIALALAVYAVAACLGAIHRAAFVHGLFTEYTLVIRVAVTSVAVL